MVSDVLFDAVEGLDLYLNAEEWDDIYQGGMRARIIVVRNAMEAIRAELNNPAVLLTHADGEPPLNLLAWAERGFRQLADDLKAVQRDGLSSEAEAATSAASMISEASYRTAQIIHALDALTGKET
jgi:hypothetical protein